MRNYQLKTNKSGLPDSITNTRFGAGEFNSLATENENAVSSSGQTLAPSDGTGESTDQMARALSIYGGGGASYYKDTGIVNAYVLTIVSPKLSPGAYFDGFTICFEPSVVNTGPSTVNVASLGIKSITYQTGSALTGGEISGTCTIKYNLANDRFEIIQTSANIGARSKFYIVDASQADQGATSTNPKTLTIYDIAAAVGSTKYATVYLTHNPIAGSVTNYNFDTSLSLAAYPNLYFLLDPGARLTRTTGNEIFTIYSPNNLLISPHQRITAVNMIAFNQGGGNIYSGWWSAVGDDSTDDTNALTAFIAAGQGCRYFLDVQKTYKVTNTLSMQNYSDIDFNGSTIKMYLNGNIRGFQPNDFCSVKNGKIQIVTAGSPTGIHQQCLTIGEADTATGNHDITVKNMVFESNVNNGNAVGFGVYGGSWNILFENITVVGNSTLNFGGVLAHWGGSDYFPGYVWDGVNYAQRPYNVVVRNFRVYDMTGSSSNGLVVGPGSNVIVENCRIHNVATGISLSADILNSIWYTPTEQNSLEKTIIVRNNILTDIRSHGIFINMDQNPAYGATDPSEYLYDYLFENNKIYGKTGSSPQGFYLYEVEGARLLYNLIENVARGIRFDSLSVNCLAMHNIIRNCKEAGITTPVGVNNSARNKILYNHIENCNTLDGATEDVTSMIYCRGDDWLIENNVLGLTSGETSKFGIYLPSGADNCIINYNNVRDLNDSGTTANYYIAGAATVFQYNRGSSSHPYLSGNGGNIIFRKTEESYQSISSGTAVPNLALGRYFVTANAAPTTITGVSGMNIGDPRFIKIGDNNTTIDFTGTNLKGNNGADWTPNVNDMLVIYYDGSNYICETINT